MALKSAADYLTGLKRLGHRVFIQGERVDDIVEHPISRPAALAMAETFRQAEGVEAESLYTAVSPIAHETVNRFTHIHRGADDLVQKILMLRDMGQQTASCFQRCAGMDCLNTLFAITYETDERYGTEYHPRFLEYLKHVQANDLVPAACMTDPKGDRALSPGRQPDRDLHVRIVDRSPAGIVIRGAKVHITGAVNSHELIVVPTRALGSDEREFAVACAVPATARGVTMVYGRQPSDTRRLEPGRPDVGNLQFGGCEALVVFDEVFVPSERVFLNGEHEMAGLLVELFAAHHRASYGGCKVGVGDVLIGAVAALAEIQGTAKAAHVRDKLAEMVHLNETLHGVALAAAARGRPTASGAWTVDALLANVCKLNVTRLPFEIARLAQDIAGGLLVTMPSVADADHPEIGGHVRKYLKTRGEDGCARMRLLRLVENLTLGTGAVSYLTESVHGAGSPQAQKIMIGRLADLEVRKAWAWRLCGLE